MSIISNFDKFADVVNKLKVLGVIKSEDILNYTIHEKNDKKPERHVISIQGKRDNPEEVLHTIVKVLGEAFPDLKISSQYTTNSRTFLFIGFVYEH